MLTKQERQEKTEKKIEEIKEGSKELKPKGHLTLEEREKITVLNSQKYSKREIARILKRNCIFQREIFRGADTRKSKRAMD